MGIRAGHQSVNLDGLIRLSLSNLIKSSPMGDGKKPCGEPKSRVIAVQVAKGLDKRFLSGVLGVRRASRHLKAKSKNRLLITLHQGAERLQRASAGLLDQ